MTLNLETFGPEEWLWFWLGLREGRGFPAIWDESAGPVKISHTGPALRGQRQGWASSRGDQACCSEESSPFGVRGAQSWSQCLGLSQDPCLGLLGQHFQACDLGSRRGGGSLTQLPD